MNQYTYTTNTLILQQSTYIYIYIYRLYKYIIVDNFILLDLKITIQLFSVVQVCVWSLHKSHRSHVLTFIHVRFRWACVHLK